MANPARFTAGGGRIRWGAAALLSCGTAALISLGGGFEQRARAQDLVGCQLLGGTLQCVPGLSADPQRQIQVLEAEIQADQQQQGRLEQQISGLGQLVLRGEAVEGGLLAAGFQKLVGAAQQPVAAAQQPGVVYHWYRLTPGQGSWLLINGASGATYMPAAADVGQRLMVVAVLGQQGSVKRAASVPVGPVLPAR